MTYRCDQLRKGLRVLFAFGLAGVSLISGPPVARATSTMIPVYADTLATGWQDWSWGGPTVNYANTAPVQAGSNSIALTFTSGWSGFQLGYGGNYLSLSPTNTFRFWIHGGKAGGQPVQVTLGLSDGGSVTQSLSPKANTWTEVALSLVNQSSRQIASIQFFNNSAAAQPTFYLDSLSFVSVPYAPPPPVRGPNLTVDASQASHAISPDIYGINFATPAVAAALHLPVNRWGGNATSRYNWQLDVYNTGGDWYFENIPEPNSNVGALPKGSALDRFVAQNRQTATDSLVTMPLIGWTPKRRVENHPYDCGFQVSKYGPQASTDPWDTNCGNGVHSGKNITGNDPTDTSTAITPSFVTAWLKHLTGQFGTAAKGGVRFYALDNEPMLWNSTHRDVHPSPTSYDEMLSKTLAYASAIKTSDPKSMTLGPVGWGWCEYLYSAVDGCSAGSDYQKHGNMNFAPWYLQQMKAYHTTHQARILDYFDEHFYPQANGVSLSGAGDSATQALRLRSTRSLWDTSYVDESWIGQPIAMIRLMKKWISQYYPGTKTSLTEYNWGAPNDINGALAQADVLGIFGREGLDLATLWWGPSDTAMTPTTPVILAFKMYRNYDGQGSGFGENSLAASSANQGIMAVYAARRQSDQTVTVMVINKTGKSLTSTIALSGVTTTSGKAQVFTYGPPNLAAILQRPDLSLTPSGFDATVQPNTVALYVIKSAP